MGFFGDLFSKSDPPAPIPPTQETEITNESSVSMLQKTLNKDIQSSFVSNVQSSTQAVRADQNLVIKRINTDGMFSLKGVDFSQYVQVDFGSISENNVKEKSTSTMTASLLNDISKDTTPQQQAQLAAAVKAATGLSGSVPPPSQPSSEVNSVLKQHTSMNVDVKNYVTNVVEKHTKKMNVQECSQSIQSNQTIEVEDVNAKKGVIIELIKMEQVTDAVLKCEAVNKTSSGVINEIIKDMGGVSKPKPPAPLPRPSIASAAIAASRARREREAKAKQEAEIAAERKKAKQEADRIAKAEAEAEREANRITEEQNQAKLSMKMMKIGGIIFLIVFLIVVLVIMYKLFASKGGKSQKGGFLKIKNVHPMIIIAIIFLILKKNSIMNK